MHKLDETPLEILTMQIQLAQVPEADPRPEHMCAVCNRNTSGCDRVRLRKDGKFVASIHAECAFGERWDADATVEHAHAQ